MSAGDWIAIGVSGFTLVVVLGAARGLRRSIADLQASVDDLAAGAATLDDLKAAVREPGEPDITEEPEAVVSRVPPVLRTRSVVKAMALGTGTAHAARRLRNGRAS